MTKQQFLQMLCEYIPSFKYRMQDNHSDEMKADFTVEDMLKGIFTPKQS